MSKLSSSVGQRAALTIQHGGKVYSYDGYIKTMYADGPGCSRVVELVIPDVSFADDTSFTRGDSCGVRIPYSPDNEYPIIADPIIKKQGKESVNMEKFTTMYVVDPASRVVKVYVEDDDGKFLEPLAVDQGSDFNRVDRKLGDEPPIFARLPQEIFDSLRGATRLT